MLYKGYRALLRGQKVIDIVAAIGGGGLDAQTPISRRPTSGGRSTPAN
jgi:hypothetical protein